MRDMTIRLDHTIVPAKDKVVAAQFFAEIFDLTVKPGSGYFAQVQVNDSLTLDFADEPEPLRTSHHYAFHVSDAEFEGIWGRVKAKQLPYGSGPSEHTNGKIYTRRGGRGFYFADPNGHLLEVMTVQETGS
jgi:catechol 2,3-dioxygenase-like lactoylglutathione lyase family enzyme